MGTEDGSGSSKQLSVHQGIVVDRHSDSHPRDFSQISKHQEIVPERLGGSGTSKHPETHPQVTLGIGNSDHIYTHPDFIDGNGSSEHFKTCSAVVDGSGIRKSSETHPTVLDRIDSSELMVMHPDTTSSQNDPTKKLRTSSSSSSAVSSSQELFQVELRPSSASSVSLSKDLFQVDNEGDTLPALLIDENNIPSSSYSRSQELDNVSFDITSISQGSQVTDEFSVHDFPPTQSPPIQVMDPTGEYDPFRIPSSIFEGSKSTAPQEWSTASNESLFSIRIGNSSLSRESFLMLGEDTFRSDEFMFSPNTPVSVVGAERTELEKSKATGESDECLKVEIRETMEGQSKEQAPPEIVGGLSPSFSDQANGSAHSFAFQVKKNKKCASTTFFCCRKECKRKKCVWPWCYCSNCSCTFCYCLWPSCYCSNCSWAFSYCWNCSPKRWSSHSSAILTEVKPDVEKQQQKPQATEVTSKSVACNWLSCFSCCPRCCCSFFSFPGCSCSSCSSSRWSWLRCSCHCCSVVENANASARTLKHPADS